ncbi:MAG: hypothetical protein JRD69_07385 [Deltaproteobacteria bacterium]|nr:hypothetical protein [Deltaproteobacteria bacterium]
MKNYQLVGDILVTHRRRSIRLKGYDYSQAGLYFITMCTHNRLCLFGEIKNGEMILNEYGEIAEKEWIKTSKMRANIYLDVFGIMPNHVHGIIEINGIVEGRGTMHRAPTPVWQRNYYEHIIRNEKSCHQIAEYIQTNPLKWRDDKYYESN